MISFIGEYESTIDSKGRFLLPADFRKQLPDNESDTFIITRGFEACLTLYPIQSWKPLFKEISLLNDFDPEVREFRRQFMNGAMQIKLDTAGRLLVPKSLFEHASIEKDIVLASGMNKLEIWDKIKYKQFFEPFTPQTFSKLASKVMKRKDDNLFNGRQN